MQYITRVKSFKIYIIWIFKIKLFQINRSLHKNVIQINNNQEIQFQPFNNNYFQYKMIYLRWNPIGECQHCFNIIVTYHLDDTRNDNHSIHIQYLYEDICQYRRNPRRGTKVLSSVKASQEQSQWCISMYISVPRTL